ncbi:MAG TPA: riboflavin kinase [Candidatus Limnocylindrales bacterium]|nr:riboflavin kinase [Candidatus Limnocylindrales bacterium]
MNELFRFTGIVIRGKNRGKALGFPTANTDISKSAMPGIYISKTIYDKNEFSSITFIGEVKTFNESNFAAETYILDFNQDIYGEEIQVHILKKLRDNQKFESVENLILQMKEDEKQTRKYFRE